MFDVTEPIYVKIGTDQSGDGYCPKRVRIRMGDKKTYYDTGHFPDDHFRYQDKNDEIYPTTQVNDDGNIWKGYKCKAKNTKNIFFDILPDTWSQGFEPSNFWKSGKVYDFIPQMKPITEG